MRPIVIAEACCNHQGNMEIAKDMIRKAAICGADCIKFQKRDLETHAKNNPDWKRPHPNFHNAFGATYYDHRAFLEFSLLQHKELKKYCDDYKIRYSCSVWDLKSAKEIASLKPDYVKIPSACNLNIDMLGFLFAETNIPIHISLGMTTRAEIQGLYDFCEPFKDRIVFYHCTSGYPVPFEEINLLELTRKTGFKKGFSGHHLGIAIDIAAFVLGAEYIERHFTLDRTLKGTDHAASLEPQGLTKVIRDLKAVDKTMFYKDDDLTPVEIPQRDKLKWPTSMIN